MRSKFLLIIIFSCPVMFLCCHSFLNQEKKLEKLYFFQHIALQNQTGTELHKLSDLIFVIY